MFVKRKKIQRERALIPGSGLSVAPVSSAVAMLFCRFPVV